MKKLIIIAFIIFCSALSACNERLHPTNGETIYRTGRNLTGEKLLDKNASTIKFRISCITCHGKNGDRMNPFLSNLAIYQAPIITQFPTRIACFFAF